MNPTAKRGQAYTFSLVLVNEDLSPVEAPTISAGDFRISKDFGSFTNLATLPTVEPIGGSQVKVSLSGSEMTADNIMVRWSDADGEWLPGTETIQTVQSSVDDMPDFAVYAEVWDKTISEISGVYDWETMTVADLVAWLVAVSGHKFEQSFFESILNNYAEDLVIASSVVGRSAGVLERGKWG